MRTKTRVWRADQSWHYEMVWEIDGHKLRTTVRRNAYDAQSSAKVDRWDGEKWQNVVRRTIEEMGSVQDISYVQGGVVEAHFEVAEVGRMGADAAEIVCQED